MKDFLIPFGAFVALLLAFGGDASADPSGAVFTGASFVKIGAGFYDAKSGQQITRAEAERRAADEGVKLP